MQFNNRVTFQRAERKENKRILSHLRNKLKKKKTLAIFPLQSRMFENIFRNVLRDSKIERAAPEIVSLSYEVARLKTTIMFTRSVAQSSSQGISSL